MHSTNTVSSSSSACEGRRAPTEWEAKPSGLRCGVLRSMFLEPTGYGATRNYAQVWPSWPCPCACCCSPPCALAPPPAGAVAVGDCHGDSSQRPHRQGHRAGRQRAAPSVAAGARQGQRAARASGEWRPADSADGDARAGAAGPAHPAADHRAAGASSGSGRSAGRLGRPAPAPAAGSPPDGPRARRLVPAAARAGARRSPGGQGGVRAPRDSGGERSPVRAGARRLAGRPAHHHPAAGGLAAPVHPSPVPQAGLGGRRKPVPRTHAGAAVERRGGERGRAERRRAQGAAGDGHRARAPARRGGPRLASALAEWPRAVHHTRRQLRLREAG
eukprot:scaffold8242_cov99-Isochrysis_galbana.AAC.4